MLTIFGSGKYFRSVLTIELRVIFGENGGVTVNEMENDISTVTARVPDGEKNWSKWAGDTLEELARFYADRHGDVPSEEIFDAWHEATAIVWHRALFPGGKAASGL